MTATPLPRRCTPCRGGIPPLSRAEAEEALRRIPGWTLADDGRRLERRFTFSDFAAALRFVIAVGEAAEREGHHPDIALGWGYATVSWQTRKIMGLHDNDFIMAAQTDTLASPAAR